MIQVAPDWSARYTPAQAEHELVNFKFKGPGLYILEDEFLIVVPIPPEVRELNTIWHQTQPEGTVFDFHYYNVPFEQSIFGVKPPPTRSDER